MIRRDITLPNESRHWSLISQIEHARISGELAEAWGNERVAPVLGGQDNLASNAQAPLRHEVLLAIHHHDDGWSQWQRAPQIDPHELRPFSFTEMPLEESLSIWRASILACATIAPLAGWMVAGHFVELLRRSSSSDTPAAEKWLVETASARERWLAEWQAGGRGLRTAQLAETALLWLRCFDALSLWLCCGSTEELRFPPLDVDQLPLAQSVTFTAERTALPEEDAEVSVAPWPFSQDELQLCVPSLWIPVRAYKPGEEIAKAGEPHEHRWHLKPHVAG